jgi:hypothetical protein
MVVRHMSISVSEEVEELIRAAAEAAGMPVSTWLSEAAQRAAAEQAAIADGRAAVTEYEAEYGPISREGRERARHVLLDAGVIAPPAQRTAR